jgi:hypothetical protein
MRTCDAALSDEALLRYWLCETSTDETDQIEEHLFDCAECAERLERTVSLGMGLKELVLQGRVSGVVSRTLLNRLQRDGLNIRLYSLAPGDIVRCTIFPGDDLVAASLHADFSGVRSVSLLVTGPDNSTLGTFDDVPVSGGDAELVWAPPTALVRQFPSMRLRLTLTSADQDRAVLGEYVLDHSAFDPDSD